MIQGLILAAGKSSRFGSDKLQLKLNGDQAMVAKIARSMKSILPETVTVLSKDNAKTSTDLALEGNHVAFSEHSYQGFNHTVADAISMTRHAKGWILAMGDMPFVKPETIQMLARALELGAHIAVPSCHDRPGYPVAFSSRYRQRLMSLDGENGLTELLEHEAAKITKVAVNDPGILFDIDQPEDLQVAEKFFINS